MEEVTKCSYIRCLDTEENGRIFHELPICDTALCVKWLINSGHEDLIGRNFNALRSIKFFVCSNHFTNDSYIAKGTLKENAVPWPHWKTPFKTNYNLLNKKSNQCLSSNPNSIAGIMDKQEGRTNVKYKKRHKNSLKNSKSYKNGNSDEWCRTCAMKKPNLVNMTVKTRNTEMSLLSKLKLLIEIDDEDTLPMNMCSDCVIKLEQSFQFFQQIYVADNTLRQIFPKKKLMSHDEYNGIAEKVVTNEKQECDVQKVERKASIIPTDTPEDGKTMATEMIAEESISPQIKSNKSESAEDKDIIKEETVFSLLTDTCHSDEELDWTDVLNVMEDKQEIKEQSVNPESKRHVQCKYCESKFELKPQLRKHILEEHPNFAENLCIDCITSYDSKSQLLEHRARCHNEKKYQCDYCKKPFNAKIKLTKHIIRFHLRGRNYLCNTCNKRFLTKRSLCEHMKKIHRFRVKNGRATMINKNTKNSIAAKKIPGKKGKVGYRCKLCTKLFANAERLAVHLKTHSIRDWESYKAKVFHCGECTAKRFSMEKLRIHEMKCHLAKRKDFVCLLCETKSFPSAEEYSRHISLHCKRFKIINPLS